ncbi:amino acid permease [Solirubrobacter ginsenosidimutans]|uniref:Amino acid permease n=1 Tax=Solirubrobacter ginsenosidimutans TaxID=490573 RepID=A0A9X3MPT3_9ACTN|nr:universal stress protein [Solirubrobacter ginsenosidimutans]MDA0159622.1 amino acid permease [Solirubrobacter ginsenosidimutans]
MARRRLEGLERVLGVNALFSTAYGNVGSSIYYALGLVASYALGLTPLVFIITGFFFLCTAASYAEATTMYPEAGGSSSFARRAFNEFWSFFAAWAQMLTYVATIATSAFFVPHYLGGLFWDGLKHSPGDVIFTCITIAILGAINIVGVKESTGVNVLLAVVDFLTQLLLVLIGVFLVFDPQVLIDNVHFGVAPTWTNFVLAIPIGMLAYTGIETVSNMSEEAKDESTTIPKAIARVRLAVFAIYFTLPAVALSALPVKLVDGKYQTLLGVPDDQGGSAGDPVLGVVRAMDLGVLQKPAELYVGLLAATILFLATNAGLIGISRLVYSMGIHRQLPDALRRLHPKYRTPWIGIIVFSGFAILVTLPGKATFLGSVYSFGALLSFTMAHLAVIRLRMTKPDFPRPYRGPGNAKWRGVDWPLFAVAGGTFTAIAFVVIVVLNPTVAAFGVGWLILGMVVYLLFRRRQGLDLTSTHKVAIPQPVVDHEAEYDSVLVPMGSDHYDESVVATAAKLAARRRRGIHVLAMVTVPSALPIDGPMPEQEAAAQSLIEQARVQAGARVSGHVERVRTGQAGRRIIEEAIDMRAAAIVMPLPERVNGASLFGKTLETVLAERPCRVIIESAPAPEKAKRRALERALTA